MAEPLLDPESDPQAIIRSFGMKPHPEGGWYAEMYRSPSSTGTRSAVSAIYFLLEKGQRSQWHTVDACEIWLWHAGSRLRLHLAEHGMRSETVLLGIDIAAGEQPQAVVPTGVWQAAESDGAWTLVSCVVAPAFEFAGFTIAAPGWSPDL